MTKELILGWVLAAVGVSLAIVWIRLDQQKKSRRAQHFALLRRLGEEAGLSLSSQETIAGGVLGFDVGHKVLLALQYKDNRPHWYTIPLAAVESCTVLTTYEVLPTAATNLYAINESIDEVLLQFHFRNGDPPVAVPFYSARHYCVAALAERESKVRGWQHFLSALIDALHSNRA